MDDGPSRSEIDQFIRDNDVDSRAAADLQDCPPDLQRKVLARGELSTARNPSAAVLARIRDARASNNGSSGSGLRSSTDVEEFIKTNDVDESAADSLRSSSPTVQRTVLSRGELKTARNPSSALLARIRDAKIGVGNSGYGASIGAHTGLVGFNGANGCMTGAYGMGAYFGMGAYPASSGHGSFYPGGCGGYPAYPGAAMYPGYPAGAFSGAPGGFGMAPGGLEGAYVMTPYGPQYSAQCGAQHSSQVSMCPSGATPAIADEAGVERGPKKRRRRERSRRRRARSPSTSSKLSSSHSRSGSRSRDRSRSRSQSCSRSPSRRRRQGKRKKW